MNEQEYIAHNLKASLVMYEDILWEFETNKPNTQIKYDDKTLRAAMKVFASVTFSKMYDHLQGQGIPFPTQKKLVVKYGHDIRNLLLDAIGIDCSKLYDSVPKKVDTTNS
jgi:hypothetical protein